jgi:serine/threonine protein kinase
METGVESVIGVFETKSMEHNSNLSTYLTAEQYKDTGLFVDFLGWFQHGSEVFLAMEYVLLGDLETNVKALSAPLPQVEAKDVTRQILLGLQIMHAESFAHRDLKPQVIYS